MATKTIDTLVEDIYQMIDDGDVGDLADVHLDDMLSDIGEAVTGMLNRSKDHRGAVRLSAMGQPCARKQWYDHREEYDDDEPLQPHVRIKFLFGHIIEALVLYLAKTAGHEVTDEQKEVSVNGVKGHMDAKIDGVVVDVKSASSPAFKKFESGTLAENDAFGYITQLSSYMEAEGDDEGVFVAMDKQLGKLCVMKQMKKLGIPEEIEYRKQLVTSDELPDRGASPVADGVSGNLKLPTVCSYCAHKRTCYPNLRTFAYANGLRHLTTVVKQPNVPEVFDDNR